jgi:hypothetical protein
VAQQGAGPPRPGRPPARGARGGYWDTGGYPPQAEQRRPTASQPGASQPSASQPGQRDDEEFPAWAIPSQPRRPRRDPRPSGPPGPAGIDPTGSGPEAPEPFGEPGTPQDTRPAGRRRPGRPSLPLRARARAARARKTRRRLVMLGGLAAVAGLVAVLVIVLPGTHRNSAGASGFVTRYQPGEFRSAPGACQSVQPSTLAKYLPGKRSMVAAPNLPDSSGNQCNWTLDQQPVYRLLEVTAQAYAPSGLATGNGSATAAATDAYNQAMASFRHPVRGSHQPAAQINSVPGLGSQTFSAFQVIKVSGSTTDRVTVVLRFRNVLITAQFNGLAHAGRGRYGPVSPSLLKAGAAAAATDVLHKLG